MMLHQLILAIANGHADAAVTTRDGRTFVGTVESAGLGYAGLVLYGHGGLVDAPLRFRFRWGEITELTMGPQRLRREPVLVTGGGATVTLPLRLVLDWYMVSDPWPLDDSSNEQVGDLLAEASRQAGFDGWVVAYHELGRTGSPSSPGVTS